MTITLRRTCSPLGRHPDCYRSSVGRFHSWRLAVGIEVVHEQSCEKVHFLSLESPLLLSSFRLPFDDALSLSLDFRLDFLTSSATSSARSFSTDEYESCSLELYSLGIVSVLSQTRGACWIHIYEQHSYSRCPTLAGRYNIGPILKQGGSIALTLEPSTGPSFGCGISAVSFWHDGEVPRVLDWRLECPWTWPPLALSVAS